MSSSDSAWRRVWRAGALIAAMALVALATGAQCKPDEDRVVVFLQGLYTAYDEGRPQRTALEEHRFDTIKGALRERGYDDARMLDFSYAGGTLSSSGGWRPAEYACEDTDRPLTESVETLERMLRGYGARHRRAHFALVGHSIGGNVAMLAGARDAARPEGERIGITSVVTLDAPLHGVSPDKKVIIDLVPCEKTYLAGAELVALRADPATPGVRRLQAAVMAQEGVWLATFGNENDCLWNPAYCAGGEWAYDADTQFIENAAAVRRFVVDAPPLLSHDAILADPAAVAEVAAFIGAPE